MFLIKLLAVFIAVESVLQVNCKRYQPTWSSLDTRPLPSWYDDVKLGIFIHWGVFSVPSFHSEWFWWDWQGTTPTPDVANFMNKNYPPDFTYGDFGGEFHAEFFNASEWVDIFKASGAKYIVLTSKHHEGFCLWPSANSWNWNSMSVGPHKDLVGELATALRNNSDIKFGLYHSLFEWFNPLYLQDKANNFTTQDFVSMKTMPELYDLVNKYQPEVIWSDGEWETTDVYWNSTEFIAWLYNDSPVSETIVVNDRWGAGDLCHHGDFYTCADNYNPHGLVGHKWENCMPLDQQSWGYRRDMTLTDVLTIEQIISSLVETVSYGGNLLVNIGPTKEGTIAPIFEERLRQLGQWLNVNGEAIYSTTPWKYQNDTTNPNVWYTLGQSGSIYAILLKYPQNETQITLSAPTTHDVTTVNLLGYSGIVQWLPSSTGVGLIIDISQIDASHINSKWAWVFKLVNVS